MENQAGGEDGQERRQGRKRDGAKSNGTFPSHATRTNTLFPTYKMALMREKQEREGGKGPFPVQTSPSPLEDIILKIYFISQLHYGTTKSCESNLRTDYLLTYFI